MRRVSLLCLIPMVTMVLAVNAFSGDRSREPIEFRSGPVHAAIINSGDAFKLEAASATLINTKLIAVVDGFEDWREEEFIAGYAFYALIRAALHHHHVLEDATLRRIQEEVVDYIEAHPDTFGTQCGGLGDTCAEEYMGAALGFAAHNAWSGIVADQASFTQIQQRMRNKVNAAFESISWGDYTPPAMYSFLGYYDYERDRLVEHNKLFNHGTENPVYGMLTIDHIENIVLIYEDGNRVHGGTLKDEVPDFTDTALYPEVANSAKYALRWIRHKIDGSLKFADDLCVHSDLTTVCPCSDKRIDLGGGVICNEGGLERHPNEYPMLWTLFHLGSQWYPAEFQPWTDPGMTSEACNLQADGQHNYVFNCTFRSDNKTVELPFSGPRSYDPGLSLFNHARTNQSNAEATLQGSDQDDVEWHPDVAWVVDSQVVGTLGAYEFIGNDAWIQINDSLNQPESITLETWVRVDGTTTHGSLIQKQGAYELFVEANAGNHYFKFEVTTQSGGTEVISSNAIQLGQGYQVVGTFDGTSGEQKLFVNRELVDQDQTSTGSQVAQPAGNAMIGEGVNGLVGNVSIYDVALSEAQVQWLYHSYVSYCGTPAPTTTASTFTILEGQTTSDGIINMGGGTGGTVTLEMYLSDGSSGLAGREVTVEVTNPVGFDYSITPVRDDGDGFYSAVLTSGGRAGRIRLSFRADTCGQTFYDDEVHTILFQNQAYGCLPGDANGSNDLEPADATAVMLEWSDNDSNTEPTAWPATGTYTNSTPCADANGDGRLEPSDATAVMLMWSEGM